MTPFTTSEVISSSIQHPAPASLSCPVHYRAALASARIAPSRADRRADSCAIEKEKKTTWNPSRHRPTHQCRRPFYASLFGDMILSAAACRSSASRENLCTAHPLVFTCPLERLGLRPDLEEKRRDAHELPLAAWREKCSLIIICLWAPQCMSTRRICTSSLQDKREMERVRWGGQCCNKDDKTGLASFSFLSGR